MTTNSTLHVVFGAGQIGSGLARVLQAQRLRVRVVRRNAKPVGEGIEVVAGDARDAAFVLRASEGAAVIYHCMNASSYTARAWEAELPLFADALIAAALAHDARLVCLDNLYGYGPTEGPRVESTPQNATGRKALVRVQISERLAAARAAGLRYTMLRPGDYFGPGTEQALMSDAAVRGIAAGKRPMALGDPNAVHAFSYVPDVSAALAALGTATNDVEGQIFHAPMLQIAPRELLARIGTELGVKVHPRAIGTVGMTLLAPFVSALRELRESYYQWDRPFLASDARFRERFPSLGTPLDEAVRETARVARPQLTL